MKKIPLIIDCDPGVDDALAIMLAQSKSCFDLKAITSVAGNVTVNYTTHNLQLLKTLLNIQCPIAQGEKQPLVKQQVTASKTHGSDGFGGYAHLLADIKLAPLSELTAVQLIAKTLMESAEKVVIVAIGPLTNIAILVKAYPHLLNKIECFSIMGGGLRYGNVTATAEFNFYVDPEAAQIVFNSGVPIILAPLDVTLQTAFGATDIERMSIIDNEVAQIATKILSAYAANDAALHDPVSVLAISNPELFTSETMYLQIETNEGATRAMSYADNREKNKKVHNCTVLTSVNKVKFADEIAASLQFYQ